METVKWKDFVWCYKTHTKWDANCWVGYGSVIGRCDVCGDEASGVVQWTLLGPLTFYCDRHYKDAVEGRTDWWALERLVIEANGHS